MNYRTTKQPTHNEPAWIDYNNLSKREQICVAFLLFQQNYYDMEVLNPLLKRLSLDPISKTEFGIVSKMANLTDRLVRQVKHAQQSLEALRASESFAQTYDFLLAKYKKAWNNAAEQSCWSRELEHYVQIRLTHSVLFNQPEEWETFTDDPDKEAHYNKLRVLATMEKEGTCFHSFFCHCISDSFKFKQLALRFRIDGNFASSCLHDNEMATLLTSTQEPFNVHWGEAWNILAWDILTGTWKYGDLLKNNTHMDEAGLAFLKVWEDFKEKKIVDAKDDVEKILRFLLANGEQYVARRLSKTSLLVLLLAAAWSRQDGALQAELVALLKNANEDGGNYYYATSEPAQGLPEYYDAFWKASCGQKVPSSRGSSWDNLGTLARVIRLISLYALPAKFKNEDHVEKGLWFVDQLLNSFPLMYLWCARQLAILPTLQMGNSLRTKLATLADTVKEMEAAHPEWYMPEIPVANDAHDELATALRRILGISKTPQPRKTAVSETTAPSKRIAWIVALEKEGKKYSRVTDIIPRQYVCKKGAWNIGAGMNRASLNGKTAYDLLPEEEHLFHILARFCDDDFGYNPTTLNIASAELLTKVRCVFVIDDDEVDDGRFDENAKLTPAVFERRSLPANVKEEKNGALTITLPDVDAFTAFPIVKLSEGTYAIMEIDKSMRELDALFKVLGSSKNTTIPAEVVQRIPGLLDALGQHYQLNTHLSQDTLKQMPTIDCDIALVLRIHIQGNAYQLTLFTRPIAGEKLLLTPGVGAEQLTTNLKGQSMLLIRKLKGEARRRDEFIQALPELEGWENAPCSWNVEGTEEMLALLEKLKQLPEQLCELEWDNSKPVRVCTPLSWKNIAFSKDTANQGWFDMGGEVPVDDDKVIQLQQLFDCVHQTEGNFVKLDDQTYVRLTGVIKRQLQALELFAQKNGATYKLPPAALPLLGAFYTDDSEQPEALKTTLKSLGKKLKLEPQTPAGLRAELRPYQRDGFVWMRRLAECGLGCCLADDMGIGKTVQALTLLLDIAQNGPSLVVVPASLLAHWYRECQRFTPDLIPMVYAGSEEERTALLSSAKNYSLVITTYGCLQGDIEAFNQREWNCVLLDEAQSIKNRETKRSRATKSLRCKFRLALSGTPVENNLMELWSIFDFLNPGMLGSEKQFQEKMDAAGDKVSPALKRAISPLMLRRTKAEVLAELPEKTEITLNIDLPTENREQYEALRRNAKLILAEPLDNTSRVKILAQLTKLRCFCCAPELAGIPNAASPKLDMLMNLAAELKRAGHRTLIFSQFVKFLDLVRSRFDKENLTYSYLDGSTPAQQRSKIVDEFNHGKNAFFLISLKAGGLGLNLSSADFVILLDAWWNPAVENQAIDRAHRIGQTHPVTVYRMVCNDTVEEKILELHQKKRFLAEEIFDENQTSSLKLEELMKLI